VRAALLPTPGNPKMVAYWLANFETWREHVDQLVVLINGGDPVEMEESAQLVRKAGGVAATVSHSMGHDGAMRWLLEYTLAPFIVMCEDDAYVRRPEEVDRAFEDVEALDQLVGSPRHEDYAGQYQRWGGYARGDFEEMRHGLWPAFLFAHRDDLLATDRLFGDRMWYVGQEIEGWGKVTRELCEFVGISPEYVHLDTLFGTTFQLRAAGLMTALIHHVRLFDARAAEEWIAEDPPWFHVTGLSTLSDALSGRPLPDLDEHGGLWTRRVAWWRRVGIDMREVIARLNIRETDLAAWDERFDRWVR
jgi:hypothetical protein